jgi:predicted lipid-binding transport protein (Tim44 family)
MTGRFRRLLPILAIGMALSLSIADTADAARRGFGGGFGSRGARTYQVPRATNTAPRAAQPIDRTMTSRNQAQQAGAQRPAAAQAGALSPRRPGFLGGLGGGLLGGLMLGGLFGMMMGHGFGGAAGMMALLVQAGLIALVVMLALSFFRRRRQPQPAYAGAGASMHRDTIDFPGSRRPDPQPYASTAGPSGPARSGAGHDEIGITDQDFDAFERLLSEVQAAFGREDYAALRERTTPEAMSFLAETLAQNAGEGRRNEISGAKLLQGDLSEAWREGDVDYATVSMRYATLDVMRDRATGSVVEGDPNTPVETTEVWTFRRDGGPWGGGWKLSAVQEI